MLLIKIGGGQSINHQAIIQDLAKLEEKFLVVHGANALRDNLAKDLGYQKRIATSLSGYSSVLTDQQGIDIFLMAYAGLRNKRLVELAQSLGLNAIGLTGLDGGLLRGTRKKAIKIKSKDKIKLIRDDLSGKPNKVNTDLLYSLIINGYTPFICPPILSEDNQAINTENDNIVALLVKELGNITKIIHFIEAPGLLKDFQDESSLIPQIFASELNEAEGKYTQGRMKRKMLAVRESFAYGVKQVIFADGRIDNPIIQALSGQGTAIIHDYHTEFPI